MDRLLGEEKRLPSPLPPHSAEFYTPVSPRPFVILFSELKKPAQF